ncbi:PREDICTED: protein FAM92A1 [Tinamus guttatus]|uniref:protein FAM92A1 n=1 Tax=Tinamus guttatus TaxID=94827 RepID=UPI00052E912B|nr:PREDICTED: protein FAM92A1 [Tinamus guttatus]
MDTELQVRGPDPKRWRWPGPRALRRPARGAPRRPPAPLLSSSPPIASLRGAQGSAGERRAARGAQSSAEQRRGAQGSAGERRAAQGSVGELPRRSGRETSPGAGGSGGSEFSCREDPAASQGGGKGDGPVAGGSGFFTLYVVPILIFIYFSLISRDNQTRQIRDAVSNVEKHFGELCQIFAGYVRKTARLRDKADLLVNEIYAYAATETPNLKVGLKNFADEFSRLQDYRQAEVERLEAKVVEPLKSYGTIVKLKRDDLKATLTAKNREAKQLSQLEKTRQRNPSDRHIISQAESELQRASLDATRTTRQLEETIDNFEKQKIKDIKNIFSEFITIEMLFHGKALEIYTAAYQNIQNIDENEDLEVFRSSLYPPDYQSRLDIVRANSKSPLQRTGSSKSSLRMLQPISSSRLRKDEEEEEDEEEEDEEEELDATKEER